MRFPRQYSLRLLIASITLAAVVTGSWQLYIRPFQRQEQLAAVITAAGGGVTRETSPSIPGWMRRVFGTHRFQNVVAVDLFGLPIDDRCLAAVFQLPRLRELSSGDAPRKIFGIARPEGALHLDYLNLNHTKVSDEGLRCLNGMDRLTTLWLHNTQVGDAGIEHIVGVESLQIVWLSNTRVTDEGIRQLKCELPDVSVFR